MKVNILTEQANDLERKLSVELHQRIYRTHFKRQENAVKKTKEVAVHRQTNNSLKRQRHFIESLDQMKKICEQFQGSM